MSALSKRSTVYLDPELHQALKIKSLETNYSISEIINDALKSQLSEDEEDLSAFRARKKEKSVSFESFVSKIKKSRKI